MSKEEDIELINDFNNGNPHAFDKIVIKHKNMVFGLCYKILNNFDDADDCSQEIFVKVYRSLHNFQFKSAFTTWLYRIAVNTCKNKLNSLEFRQKKKDRSLEQVKNFEQGTGNSTPDKVVEVNETNRIVQEVIQALPAKYKILIILRDMEGKSYDDIAQITGLKLGTVKSKLSRARDLLKEKLKGAFCELF